MTAGEPDGCAGGGPSATPARPQRDPSATLAALAAKPAATAQADLLRVALRYADAYEYQNVFAPLLQVEAEYDKARTHLSWCCYQSGRLCVCVSAVLGFQGDATILS